MTLLCHRIWEVSFALEKFTGSTVVDFIKNILFTVEITSVSPAWNQTNTDCSDYFSNSDKWNKQTSKRLEHTACPMDHHTLSIIDRFLNLFSVSNFTQISPVNSINRISWLL